MNDCRDLKEQMHAALDGELSAPERHALMEHIGKCAGCDATWRLLGAADGLLGRVPMVTPATGFAARVRVRMERRQQARRAMLGWLAVGLGTLLVALIAGGLSLGWLRESLGSASPSAWITYGPVAAAGLFGVVEAFVRGVWLFVRGVALYAHVNWMLMGVAAMSLATGGVLVASHFAEKGAAMRRQRSAVAVGEGI